MTSTGIKPYLWMLCGCAWFSAMTLLVRAANESCDWQIVAVARSGVATLVALILVALAGVQLVYLRPRTLWWRSLAGSASMVCTFYALGKMHGSDVLTLTNTFPSWIAILSWPMVGERPSPGVWLAVAISVVGVIVVGQSQAETGDPGFTVLSVTSALAAAFFTALAMLGLNRLKGVAPLAVVVHFSAVSTVVCLASAFAFERSTPGFPAIDGPLALLLIGVGATAAVGQVFLTLAYRGGSATNVSVVGLTQVVMVMAAEAALGWKSFNAVAVFGSILVLGPTAWLLLRERHPPPPAPDESDVPEVVID
jgi:drug/metabolite transporter (DMT)-like permease